MIIRSFYFRNEAEVDAVKALLKQMRGIKLGQPTSVSTETQTFTPMNKLELPPFVEDILNGGAYPNMEDCTHEEAAILYNKTFQSLFKAYLSARDDKVRLDVKQQIAETVKSICLTLR